MAKVSLEELSARSLEAARTFDHGSQRTPGTGRNAVWHDRDGELTSHEAPADERRPTGLSAYPAERDELLTLQLLVAGRQGARR